jgi:hypothetical protein
MCPLFEGRSDKMILKDHTKITTTFHNDGRSRGDHKEVLLNIVMCYKIEQNN